MARRAGDVLAEIGEIAALLDEDDDGYADSVEAQLASAEDPERTPSAQILQHMRSEGASFFELTPGDFTPAAPPISRR